MQCSFNSTLNFYIQQFYVFIFNDCLHLLSTLVFNIQLQRCIFTFKVRIHSTPTLCVCLTERPCRLLQHSANHKKARCLCGMSFNTRRRYLPIKTRILVHWGSMVWIDHQSFSKQHYYCIVLLNDTIIIIFIVNIIVVLIMLLCVNLCSWQSCKYLNCL